MSHGHVVPNPDGSRARCGGPGLCSECSLESAKMKERVNPSLRGPESVAADEHFGVTFMGLNKNGEDMFSSEFYHKLEQNWNGRKTFIAGYNACMVAQKENKNEPS